MTETSPPPEKQPAGKVFSTGSGEQVLEAVFHQIGDRFTHQVILHDGAQTHTLFTALEGSADETWPPSPPLQQLSIETRGASQVALLVGMAGKSHFSASVESVPGECRLEFDVAARVQTDPLQIGSTYVAPNLDTTPSCELLAPDTNSQVIWEKRGENRVVLVKPVLTKTAPLTLRWRYRIQVAL